MKARRILLTTFGSLGDLHPYLALARELQRRGHRPAVAALEQQRGHVEAAGVEYRHLWTAEAPAPDAEIARRAFRPLGGPRYIIRDLVMPGLRPAYLDTLEAADDADLLISHPLTFATPLVAEVRGLPWISTQLAPMGFLSAFDPPQLPLPVHRLGAGAMRAALRLGRWQARGWTRAYARLRAELGLPPRPDPMFEGGHAPGLVLALFSRVLGAPQPDWPAQAVQCGFAFYDAPEGAGLPPALAAFLDAGEPPIVFTLGSAAALDARGFYVESAAAARRLGRRAVLLVGHEPGNAPANLPADALAVPYAPFSLLFPRAAAVVHQGGVGTTAQALRAGRPMLVVPYGVDQPDNAERARRLGVARVLRRSSYTGPAAAGELESLLTDPEYAPRCRAVAGAVAGENGAGAACDHIKRFLMDAADAGPGG